MNATEIFDSIVELRNKANEEERLFLLKHKLLITGLADMILLIKRDGKMEHYEEEAVVACIGGRSPRHRVSISLDYKSGLIVTQFQQYNSEFGWESIFPSDVIAFRPNLIDNSDKLRAIFARKSDEWIARRSEEKQSRLVARRKELQDELAALGG